MKRHLKRCLHRLRDYLAAPALREMQHLRGAAASQKLLMHAYRSSVIAEPREPVWADIGFQVFSQADEDGILLYLFAVLGAATRTCVEIAAGDGMECNTANLILNHGWRGLLVDGNAGQVERGRQFFANHPATHLDPPPFVCTWITRENVNDLVRAHGFAGEIDLLSLDVDGIDYWLWEALTGVQPRVVVAEFQALLGPERIVTVPYRPDFNAYQYSVTRGMADYCGASLGALAKLARAKGYRLVACNRYGFNAFFVRADLGVAELPEFPLERCFDHPWAQWCMRERWPKVKDLPWQAV